MQQLGNNCLPTRQELLAAKRLAESNATSNHFLGATQRPWMTAAAPISNRPVNRQVPRSPLTSDSRGTLRVSNASTLDGVQHGIQNEIQDHNAERPSLAQDRGTPVTVEQVCTNHQDSGAFGERSFGIACSELDMQRHSGSQQIQRPGRAPLRPSSEAVSTVGALSSSPPSAVQRWQTITVSAMHRLNDFKARFGTPNKLEWQRISVLRDACAQHDYFYLCTHQIFCVAFMNPQRTTGIGFGEGQYAGLRHLTFILLSNQDLSGEVLQFFADLPAPFEMLTSDLIIYRGLLVQVGAFLQRFAAGWNLLREKCFARQFPPFVDELVDLFGVHSPVLQKVLFNSIHRQLGGTDEATWSSRALTLFDADQTQYQARKKNYGMGEVRPKESILAEQKALGEQYKAFRKETTDSTRQIVPAEHAMTAGQANHQIRPLSQNQNFGHSLRSRCASTSSLYGFNPPQWSPTESPSSLAQSVNTLGARGVLANNSAIRPFPEPRECQQLTPMTPPNFREHSFPQGTDNPTAPNSYHMRHQPPSQQRQDLPSLLNRPGFPQSPRYLAQRGDHRRRSSRGENSSWCDSMGQPTTKATLLVPPVGSVSIRTSNTNPDLLALHQAYLKSPTLEKVDAVGENASEIKLYQYLCAFASEPKFLNCESSLSSWSFCVTAAEISKKAADIAVSDSETKRQVSDGSVLYRLRSVEVASDLEGIDESDWSIKDTKWPPSCFFQINEVDIELRRKLHHGKDLPVDLTPHIREGTNKIVIANLQPREEKSPQHYVLAVEVVEVGDQDRVDSAPTMLGVDKSLRSITERLATSSDATTAYDDEVQVVGSQISVDLIDPFTATIFNLPARGKTCAHRECFDLQTFFHTRKSRVNGGPTSPDEWKCPICKKDARPQSLIVDCFLKTVGDSLVASNAAAHARAIMIGSDGSWNVKREGKNKSATQEKLGATGLSSLATSEGPTTGTANRSESMVIDIDDDDN